MYAQEQAPITPKIIEKILPFPSPVQWELNSVNSNADVSLVGMAWGLAAAPEMLAKSNEQQPNQKTERFPERPYVIALKFQARLPKPLLNMWTRSGLVLIKDTTGNMELPSELTPSGLVHHDYDLHFEVGKVSTEYWDFFPVPEDQKEFLFEVHSPAQTVLYFRVLLKGTDLTVVNATPQSRSACLQFERTFAGTIGRDSLVSLSLKRDKTTLSGTEQYARIGQTLSLTGVVDSLDYFKIDERYPKDQITGIFKGKFSADYRTMAGYFSKPDGSRLQPFELLAVAPPAGVEQTPQPICGADDAPTESSPQ